MSISVHYPDICCYYLPSLLQQRCTNTRESNECEFIKHKVTYKTAPASHEDSLLLIPYLPSVLISDAERLLSRSPTLYAILSANIVITKVVSWHSPSFPRLPAVTLRRVHCPFYASRAFRSSTVSTTSVSEASRETPPQSVRRVCMHAQHVVQSR